MLTTEAPGPAAGLGRRPTRAHIDLGALARNVRALGRRSGRRVMAVVKADGYGHGAVPVARAARAAGAAWVGCATVAEGVELRRAGDAGPILVLGGFYPEEVDEALADALTPVVYGLPPRGGEAVAADLGGATLARLAAAGRRRGRAVPVHVKLDTGMRRLGLAPDELPAFLDRLDALNARGVVLQVEGLMSHLAAADDPAEAAYTAGQRAALDDALTLLAARGHAPRERHLDNSAGCADPWAAATLVRPGIALYGAHAPEAGLVEPVMTLASAVTALRDVPAGATVS
ncbi:MAG TPA: alanine racemase, partial [Methylomirabilota bacterium]|nr:alanine racemase [Methylomirabilota bacterium]